MLRVPGIGTIRYTDKRKNGISFRILPSFSKKLNGTLAVTEENLISSDGPHNFSYWIPYIDVDKPDTRNLSSLRRLSLVPHYSSDLPMLFLITKHMCEYVAYHLLLGYHVSIPKFGQFRLRKNSSKASHRTIRFRAYPELREKLRTGEDT